MRDYRWEGWNDTWYGPLVNGFAVMAVGLYVAHYHIHDLRAFFRWLGFDVPV